jgi:hypothetical protein
VILVSMLGGGDRVQFFGGRRQRMQIGDALAPGVPPEVVVKIELSPGVRPGALLWHDRIPSKKNSRGGRHRFACFALRSLRPP